MNISKIREELGFEPQIAFDKGLAESVDWYRDNRSWWEPLRGRAQLTEGT